MTFENSKPQHQLRQYADLIKQKRMEGELDQALAICSQAIEQEPENNFFYKVQGDIYRQKRDWVRASECYLLQLRYLGDQAEYFSTFKKFYQQLKKETSQEFQTEYEKKIRRGIQNHDFSETISDLLMKYLGDDLSLSDEERKILSLVEDDRNYKQVSGKIKEWRSDRAINKIVALARHKLHLQGNSQSPKIDHNLILTLSSTGEYRTALQMIEKTQRADNKQMAALMLRNCRMLEDYSVAERVLPLDIEYIDRADFNILYELVYYFTEKRTESLLHRTLKRIQDAAKSSIPIARTLYNFYLSFGMFDEAQAIYEHIQQKQENSRQKGVESSQADREIREQESEQVVWQKMKELSTEQEHARQMIALKDLLKGFSHELGQPITNIRYAIQLQQMKRRMGKSSPDELDELFRNVLKQTERIDSLLNRFRPMVSSKGIEEYFCVRKVIEDVFNDLEGRMKGAGVQASVKGGEAVQLFGDPVQFSQVFYNLVLNAIQAIMAEQQKQDCGMIGVAIAKKKNKVEIKFWDNGPGIPKEKQQKVFEPFFTTKDPTSGNGGEGLGLYIVWNVLKMFNGIIYIDENYKDGAKFVIEINVKEE